MHEAAPAAERGDAHPQSDEIEGELVQLASDARSADAQGQVPAAARMQILLLQLRRRAVTATEQPLAAMRTCAHTARAHGHVTLGLVNLAYQFCYLLKVTPYFSPALSTARLRLVHDDGSAAVRSPSFAMALLRLDLSQANEQRSVCARPCAHNRRRFLGSQRFPCHEYVSECTYMQRDRLEKQAQVRAQLWGSALQQRSPGLVVASALLRASHALGNHTKTAVMTSLLLFKVRLGSQDSTFLAASPEAGAKAKLQDVRVRKQACVRQIACEWSAPSKSHACGLRMHLAVV